MSWKYNFTGCNDKTSGSPAGKWYYKFNLTSSPSVGTAETGSAYTTLSKEPVAIEYQWGDSTANLTVGAKFIVRMKDTLKAGDYYNITPVSWVGFEVTTNGNTFAYVGKNQTNLSTANASFTFVPPSDCTWSSGNQLWRIHKHIT